MKNNFITKIIGATLAFAMMIGGAVGINAAKQAKEVDATNGIVSVDSVSETNSDGTVSVDLAKASGQNAPITATVNTHDGVRLYANNTMVVSSSSSITALSMTLYKNGSKAFAPLTADVGSYTGANASGGTATWTGSATSITFTVGTGQVQLYEISYTISSGDVPTTYTGVTVSEKTALTGTYKGDAYYECQASVTGTGDYSSGVTWSITSSNTYGSGTSIANKATIDANGKITFLDNCTIYVWATAADGETYNDVGFTVVASGLIDNPIKSWTKVTSAGNVSVNTIYALSNDGTNFATTAVANKQIALTNSYNNIGYFVLESVSGGYHLRFATYNDSTSVWEADGNYINNSSSTDLSSSTTASSVWTLGEQSNSVYLKNFSNNNRHLGLGDAAVKAYASSNIGTYLPVYLYDTGNSLPIINCDTIQLTGLDEATFSIGDTATLGYYALGTDGEEWTGDVTYSISNESTSGVVELSATSGASVTLTAKKAGTARVSVQDDAGNAEPDYVDITVLADPERTELPIGNYDVTISYSGVSKNDAVPESKNYEIKAKEGSGANRVWYKNMTIAYSNVTASFDNEYTWNKDSDASATVTTTSEVAKVTQVIVSYYNNNRLTLKDAGNNEIPIASQSNNVCTYALNSASFSLNGTSATTSILSLTITFTVVNENEEFLSLVIDKGATATSFTEGDAPNHNGLTVHENYSTDGETISRYEDVTASVTWNYSIEKIARRTKSYTVTATYGGHTSAPVTIDGFTVTEMTKYSLFESEIVDGDYIVHYNGKALKNTISSNRATYTEIAPANNTILTNDTDIVWHIEKYGETDYYTIYNAAANKFLASTEAKNQAALVDSVTDNCLWTPEMSAGTFEFANKARAASENDPANKYLRENGNSGWGCYSTSTGNPLSLYRLNVDGYLKSATAVATYTEEASGNILRLGSSIPVETWNYITATETIEDYGVMIYKTNSVANITSETPVEDAYRDTEVAPAVARKGNGVPPTAENGNYVFTARLKVSNPNTVFCAASFVVIDGQYYFFNEQHVTAGQLA